MLNGIYIAYYRPIFKIDTFKHLSKTSAYCLIIFFAVGLIHTCFVSFYAIDLNVVEVKGVTYEDLERKELRSTVLAIVLQLLFYIGELSCFYVVHIRIKKSVVTMIRFHDYLVVYRLTPKSRVLRKHLPKLSIVIEEDESNMYNSSSLIVSQKSQLLTSTISRTTGSQTRRKFVY